MVDLEEMAKEQDQMLRELSELGMSFARKLEARIDLVNSVADAQALALAFHRIQRGVRLTLALRTKLARDHLEIDKLERATAQKAAERRKAQITAVLDSEIYVDQRDQDEADEISERLTERLDQEALFDAFLEGPVEPAIARIRKHLGLPVPPPKGEGDREAVEGVAAHSHRRDLQPPQSAALTAPPEGEHLEGTTLKSAPS